MSRRLLPVLALLFTASACSSYHYDNGPPRAPAPIQIEPATDYRPEHESLSQGDADEEIMSGQVAQTVALSGPIAGAPAVRDVASAGLELFGATGSGNAASSAPPPPAPIETDKSEASTTKEMIDIEARVTLEVASVASALVRVRKAVADVRGQVVNEVIEDNASAAGASVSVRVPSAQIQSFLSGLSGIGKLESRQIKSRDIGREYHDAQILLQNLQATLARYEKLLQKAENVKDMVALEAAMARVRTRLDRVQGDLRYLKDRAQRSTVYITLKAKPDHETVEPTAQLHPGLRATMAWDFPSDADNRSFAGGGVSVYFFRALNLDADFMESTSGDGQRGLDLFVATLGSELYSDFLGGGDRTFFNPYLGFRAGYVRNLGLNEMALGGSLGVDVWKTSFIAVDVNTRVYAFLGNAKRGAHPVVSPNLSVRFSY
ncbi:MAG: DUF4349 domain-containing protein [Myxococcales bacterium]|nr:DUF4349 domain-containing protein [Myxococcales bacterium]MCB9581519.1 DUF4349 domain-containing protein [Polyangiaceae bacterium]